MAIYQIHSEWDLGIREFYDSEEAARTAIRKALPLVGLHDPVEEYFAEGLVSIEAVWDGED